VRRRFEKYVVEGSKYGRLQNLKTSKVTSAHVITPLILPLSHHDSGHVEDRQ